MDHHHQLDANSKFNFQALSFLVNRIVHHPNISMGHYALQSVHQVKVSRISSIAIKVVQLDIMRFINHRSKHCFA